MALSWRTSVLAGRHQALGSKLEDWNGMGTAWRYQRDLADEHAAIRTCAGLMDVSGLKKVHLVGPHATAILDWVTTRDVSKVTPGKASYACMLNDAGYFIEDCIIYRTGPNAWMVVHGSGAGHEALTWAALGRNVAVLFDDDMHDLSLQGPLAADYLARHVPGLRDLKYFHHTAATLFGRPVMISRTGYTGERGYEIFCKGEDAGTIWDAIVDDGKEMGIIPCSFTALDWLRVESALMFFPYDNAQMYPHATGPQNDSLWELGLDFTVSPGKTQFRGADQHFRLKGRERCKIAGVLVEGKEIADAGDKIYADGLEVGVVTCAMYSRLVGKSMALARVNPTHAAHGTPLMLRGKSGETRATAHALPFDDPKKTKRTAVG